MRMRMLWVVLSASLLACGASVTPAEIKSGPQVGERIPGSFHTVSVLDAGKPDLSGRRWDHVERYGANPVVLVLVRKVSDPLTKLVKGIDAEVARHKMDNQKIHALIVMLAEDDAPEKNLKELAEKHEIKHVSLSVGTSAGPSAWRIAKDADVTVIFYTRLKVKANHAFVSEGLNEEAINTVIADLPKIVGK